MNGLVPIVFTSSSISRYGRMSWDSILLSLVSIALSTRCLAKSYKWIFHTADETRSDFSTTHYSGMEAHNGVNLAQAICGSRSSNLRSVIDRRNISFPLVWLIYINCITWAVWCVTKHILIERPEGSFRDRVVMLFSRLMYQSPVTRLFRGFPFWLGNSMFILTWTPCLICHFYLYTLFTQDGLVSPAWNLGQIIAVTVWFPSIIEFLYIDHSEHATSDCARQRFY